MSAGELGSQHRAPCQPSASIIYMTAVGDASTPCLILSLRYNYTPGILYIDHHNHLKESDYVCNDVSRILPFAGDTDNSSSITADVQHKIRSRRRV